MTAPHAAVVDHMPPSAPPNDAGRGAFLPDGEQERLDDREVRGVLEGYVAQTGAALREIGPDLYELAVPPEDRPAFDGRAVVCLAFSVAALHGDPDAQMAIVGSAFVGQLIAAVRRRGARRVAGFVPPTIAASAEAARLPAPVTNGTAGEPVVRAGLHPVGRLTARIAVRAGASVAEHLVDSSLFDLATGVALGADVAAACAGAGATADGSPSAADNLDLRPARPMSEVVPLMLGDLEARLAPEIDRQRDAAERALAHELARIDRYYASLLADAGGRGSDVPDAETRHAFEAEHRRRHDEEVRRHEVRATVHPLQLAEWAVPVQRAEWRLSSRDGHHAVLVAQRALVGDGRWAASCPTCGAAPTAFVVCAHDHAGCAACSARCTVCQTGFCRDHGLMACHVDGRPACDAHARTCRSCRRPHCAAHERRCTDGDHPACTSCLAACAHCERTVCDTHATETASEAPLGIRRLCATCVRHCEGGTGEVVGPDEASACASCGRAVCTRHQTVCAVDGRAHCSGHMRRTDRSRRLVCERDRASCIYEPNAILAADEVGPCATCGRSACTHHTGTCVVDARRHCSTHLVPLGDQPSTMGCGAHHSVCHVDGGTFSVTGTEVCPACERRACAGHRRACEHCGRSVCVAEFAGASAGAERVCMTCRQLTDTSDPGDRLLGAAAAAQDGRSARAKTWRTARDATHTLCELDLGWTRRLVLAVRHDSDHADVVMAHSLFGARRVSGR